MAEKKKPYSLKILHSTLMLMGFILILGAVSCRGEEPQLPETQTPSPEGSTATHFPDPTASEAAEEGSGQPSEADQCLICHADQQALENTAADLVVAESENSGEG
ncbi:MAG: hypothetical protein DRI46_02690 [Chloroflexi bacterium]|nr:MAG: hypothetical protein DRI46_02690 [Chloroflexota bacterium]